MLTIAGYNRTLRITCMMKLAISQDDAAMAVDDLFLDI